MWICYNATLNGWLKIYSQVSLVQPPCGPPFKKCKHMTHLLLNYQEFFLPPTHPCTCLSPFRAHTMIKLILSLIITCYDFSSVSLTHVFLTLDSRFTSFSFHRFNRFRSMFHIHAFYFYMPITCISTHVFHTCCLHVFFYLLITCHASMAYLYINLTVDLVVSLASL